MLIQVLFLFILPKTETTVLVYVNNLTYLCVFCTNVLFIELNQSILLFFKHKIENCFSIQKLKQSFIIRNELVCCY